MTVKAALAATLGIEVSENRIDLQLINSGLDGSADYSQALQGDVEKACIPLLYTLYTDPDVSEGGYSMSHPDFLRKVKERLLYFANKYNMTDIINQVDPKPSVTGKSVW